MNKSEEPKYSRADWVYTIDEDNINGRDTTNAAFRLTYQNNIQGTKFMLTKTIW